MAQTAIVGEKVGMTQKWVDDRMLAVTVLRVEPMRVVQIKTTERDGYTALQVTYGHRDARKLNQPDAGHYAKAGFSQDADSSKSASIRSMPLRLAKKSPSTSSPLATALTSLE